MARVVLFSYGPLVASLSALFRELGDELIAIVVPSNRSDDAVADARAAATDLGLPVLVQPRRSEAAAFADELRAFEVDALLVWHYSMLIPAEVLAVPRRGTVNVHGGLLPDYRGGHVLQWAIVNGEPETGATLHYVDETIDTGPVIDEYRVPVLDDDDAATVAVKIQEAGLSLLRRHWPAVAAGTASATAQRAGEGRYWPLRTAADGVIDWSQPAARIRNLVRALVPPWPGATFVVDGQTYAVDAVSVVEASGEPGTILDMKPGEVVVAAGRDAVALRAIRRDGERVSVDELPVETGMRLGA